MGFKMFESTGITIFRPVRKSYFVDNCQWNTKYKEFPIKSFENKKKIIEDAKWYNMALEYIYVLN